MGFKSADIPEGSLVLMDAGYPRATRVGRVVLSPRMDEDYPVSQVVVLVKDRAISSSHYVVLSPHEIHAVLTPDRIDHFTVYTVVWNSPAGVVDVEFTDLYQAVMVAYTFHDADGDPVWLLYGSRYVLVDDSRHAEVLHVWQ